MLSIGSLVAEKSQMEENSSTTSKQSVLKYWNQFFNKDN